MSRPEWRKSSFSFSNGNCVEVSQETGPNGRVITFVRNSRVPHEDLTGFTPEEWSAFVAGVKAGEFDLPS